MNPGLSASLHDAPASASSVEKPWTISAFTGDVQPSSGDRVFMSERNYTVRIATLESTLLEAVEAAFNPGHPLGREPLVLDRTPFPVMFEKSGWEKLATYTSLLTNARPIPAFVLQFSSSCGFSLKLGYGCTSGTLPLYTGQPKEMEHIFLSFHAA